MCVCEIGVQCSICNGTAFFVKEIFVMKGIVLKGEESRNWRTNTKEKSGNRQRHILISLIILKLNLFFEKNPVINGNQKNNSKTIAIL